MNGAGIRYTPGFSIASPSQEEISRGSAQCANVEAEVGAAFHACVTTMTASDLAE